MSYILDALRKADAEREIGGVPSLHARPLGWPDEDRVDSEHARTRASRGTPWAWIVLGAASAAVVMAAAWGLWRATPAPPPQPAGLPAPVALPPVVAAAPSPVPAVAPPEPPTAATPSPPPSPPPPPAAKAPPPRPAARAEAPRPPRPAPQPAVPAAPVTAATPVRLPNFNELSPELKQGLPALVVSGSVYSADPASRLLIVNGQLMKEGDALGPGAVLEKIQPKSAVVRVRDQRAVLTW